jgi:autotransporter-associated beta strand protein
VSGDIASSVGAINKYGVGTTLGISGDIETTSNLNVVEGTLALSGTAANLNVSVSSGATLQINANNVFYNSVSGGSTVVNVASGGNLILGTTGTVTDTIYNLTGSGTIQLLNASVLNVLKGNFAGGVNSTGELIKDQEPESEQSTLLLTSDSTYQGGTTVREGVLNVANTGSLTSDAVVQSGGILVVNGRIKSDSGLSIGGNVTVQNGGVLKGSGTIEGNVINSGSVAPGNSPGFIIAAGNYTAPGGSLDLELADNLGVAGTSYDQLRVGGDIDVANTLIANYSTINFVDIGGFEAARGDVFQVIADLSGNARNTLNKFDLVEYVTSPIVPDRVLLDHSTGRAYGTGLRTLTGTFRDYGVTANQKEIGRALWMESISYDKSDLGLDVDENFASTAINVPAATGREGKKTFILTSNADLGAGEEATDLGLAAVGVLIAPNAAAALDALSPEAYAGIADQGTKVARNFVRQTFVVRHRDGATDDWDFEVGYANDELTSDGTSGYNSYSTKSSQVTLSASRTLGKEFAVTVAIGSDDGKVTAQNFNTKVKTGTVGLGLTYTPESKIGRFDIAAALSSADWNSNRGGALASEDGQHSLSVGARFTLAPIDTNGVTISPYVGVIYSRTRVQGFTESDVDGTVQLEVDGFKQQSLQSELGLTVAYQLSPEMVLTGLASWEHEFRSSGQTSLNSQFIETGVDDTRFTVNSNGFGTNLYRIGLSLRYDITALSSASLSYNAVLGKAVSTGREIRANYSVRF